MSPDISEVREPRPVKRSEFAEVLEFSNYIHRHLGGHIPTLGGDFPHMFHPDNLPNFHVMRAAPEIVCSAGLYRADLQWDEATLPAGAVGRVGTAPEYRRQGLARRMMDYLTERLRGMGCPVGILWPGPEEYYRAQGWEWGGSMWRFSIGSGENLPEPSGRILTDPSESAFVEGAVALHSRRRRGPKWTRGHATLVLNIGSKFRRVPYRTKMLMQEGKPAAFLVYLAEEPAEIKECCGEPEAALSLVRSMFDDDGVSAAVLTTPTDDAVGCALRDRGVEPEHEPVAMMKVFYPRMVLAPYEVEGLDVDREGDAWVVFADGRPVTELDSNQLTQFLFGPERPEGCPEHPQLPLPTYYSPLDHV